MVVKNKSKIKSSKSTNNEKHATIRIQVSNKPYLFYGFFGTIILAFLGFGYLFTKSVCFDTCSSPSPLGVFSLISMFVIFVINIYAVIDKNRNVKLWGFAKGSMFSFMFIVFAILLLFTFE